MTSMPAISNTENVHTSIEDGHHTMTSLDATNNSRHDVSIIEHIIHQQQEQLLRLVNPETKFDIEIDTGVDIEVKKSVAYAQLLAELHSTQQAYAQQIGATTELTLIYQDTDDENSVKQKLMSGLPYQLGSTMVEYSQSVLKIFILPFALLLIYWRFRHHNNKSHGHEKNPDDCPNSRLKDSESNLRYSKSNLRYKEWMEVQRVQQHLSYRWGMVLLSAGKSPSSWFKVPSQLINERRDFKQKQKNKK